MADRTDSFLSRWSRRKRGVREEEAEAAAPAASGAPGAAAEPSEGEDEAAGDPEVVARLPDIESLDETSDFKPFLAEGVPEALRRQALRKLWRLNPLFAQLDGLNDYDEDFTGAGGVLGKIKTIYQVGKGMLGEADKEAEATGAGGSTQPPATEGAAPLLEPDAAAASGEVPPDAVAEADPKAEAEPPPREASEATPRGAAEPGAPRRHAASRRWGESRD